VAKSVLELVSTDRRDGGIGNSSARRFLDFVIEGKSLYEILGSYFTSRYESLAYDATSLDVANRLRTLASFGAPVISCLGWSPSRQGEREAASRLLCSSEPDASDGRCTIYVCPECGDIWCGAVVVKVERTADSVIWRDFGELYTDIDEHDVLVQRFRAIEGTEPLGPFEFDAAALGRVFESALGAPR
jgi:hypothetical protein